MSYKSIIEVNDLSKVYQIYELPRDRFKQLFARGEKKYFREFTALRGLSFQISKGDTVGVIGRNGSGKSTLLQMICGTLAQSTGSITVRGKVAALLELGAGFNPEFTGKENVYIAAALYGLGREATSQRFEKILAFADIGSFIDQPVKTYSSGMFVRLAFAVIAHVDADILVVDEALAVGDVFFQQKCMRFLRAFQARGGTMLFVSHDTAAVVNLCQSAIWLKNSSASDFVIGPAEEVCKSYLKDFYSQQEFEMSRDAVESRVTAHAEKIASEKAVYMADSFLENIIEVSSFNADAESFGVKGAAFIDAMFVDKNEQRLDRVKAGEMVIFRISVRVHKQITHPAFGITFKDRLGQFIISESTDSAFRSKQLIFLAGDIVTAEFSFLMPVLLQGHYSLDLAFAEGLGHDHIQHHWIHDAIALTSLKGRLVQGISGLADLSIRLIRDPQISNL